MVLKRIGVLSAAKIGGIMYAAMGLLVGLAMAGIFSIVPMGAAHTNVPSWLAPAFGVGSLVFLPILYAIMGFIGGALAAGIYNLFAGVVGGIELDLDAATRPPA